MPAITFIFKKHPLSLRTLKKDNFCYNIRTLILYMVAKISIPVNKSRMYSHLKNIVRNKSIKYYLFTVSVSEFTIISRTHFII